MQNALLLAPEGVDLGERRGRRWRHRGDGRGCHGAVAVRAGAVGRRTAPRSARGRPA